MKTNIGENQTTTIASIIAGNSNQLFSDAETVLCLLLANSEESFMMLDLDLKVQLFTSLTALRAKSLLHVDLKKGMAIYDMAPSSRRVELELLYAKVLNGTAVETETIFLIEDGKEQIWKNTIKPAVNCAGQVVAVIVTSADITEKKLAEKKLVESEERWRFAIEGSNQGIWDWNIKTNEVYYSNSWKKLFGFGVDEQLYSLEEWEKRLHPEDKPKIEKDIENHLASKNPFYESTYRLKAKNGDYRWILARGLLMERAADGSPLRMVGTHTDITEKLITEQNYKQLFESTPLPMCTLDLETFHFLQVNEAAVHLYGYSHEEFAGMTINDIRPEEDALVLEHLAAAMNKAEVENHSFCKHKKKNGEIIEVNTLTHIIYKDNKKIALILAEDVTEKLKAEGTLKQSEEQYRALFQNNPLPAWIYSLESLQFIEVNEAAITHYGFSKEEFLKMSLYDVHPKEQHPLLNKRIEAEREANNLSFPDWKHQKKNGEVIFVAIKSTPIHYNNARARLVMAHDITTKVLTENQLKTSNERFQLAAKAASEALWEWDIVSNHVYISPVYKEMFGFDIDSSRKYEEWHDYIHPEDAEETTKCFYATINDPSKEHWQKEYRYLKSDGSYLFVEDHCIILRNEEGKAIKAVGAMQDISRRKEAEQEIRISNERFGLVTKATSDAIYDWDLTTNNIVWGDGLYTLFGYKSDEISIKEWEEYIHPVDKKKTTQNLFKTVSETNKKIWKMEYRFKKADGTYSYVVEKGFIVRNEDGKPMRMIGAIQDITDQKLKEQELLESNERFDAVLKATHDLIWDWDLETGLFYRDSNGVEKVYGVSDKKSIDNIFNWLQRIHPDDYDHVQNVINDILKVNSNDNFDVEYRFLRDDGQYSSVFDRGIVLRNSTGKPVRMIGAAQDITERKKLEQQLLKQELEKQKVISQATIETQERERSEIGKELHDNVNQVLTTTKLYLELSQSNPELKDELIQKSSKNIIYVINEIRQLSRSLMNPSIGDLGLVDSVNDLIENINLTRKLQVILNASEDVDENISDNQKLMIFRIIQENLNNALKHARAKTVMISLKKKENNLELLIKDDGIGFDINTIKKGAGLKNIQNRVYLANGSLSIISAPGKGCKMLINLSL